MSKISPLAYIHPEAVIGDGCELKNVILDKNVTVTPGTKLIGSKSNPIVIKRGETV